MDRTSRIPDDEAVKALHININRQHRDMARLALQKIYSVTANTWPLHIHMRAVPLLKDAMNSSIKQDIHHLIGRQQAFNDEDCGKRKISCWEIKELDFASTTTGRSLWDYIMESNSPITTKNNFSIQWTTCASTGRPLFLPACLPWKLKHGIWCRAYLHT